MNPLDVPVNLVSFVSVDVETTGLDPTRDMIVEVAAVKVRGGTVIEEFSTLVQIDRSIPHEAQRVHHITNAMLTGQPRIEAVLPRLIEFAGDGTLVEHSYKAFDVGFLEHAHGSRLAAPYINTCTLSRRLFPFHRKHSLAECCRRHQIVHQSQHRALGDARATAQLLITLVALSATRYPRLRDLLEVASVERPSGAGPTDR